VFCTGLLWGSKHYLYKDAPPTAVEKAQRWKALAERYNLTLVSCRRSARHAPSVTRARSQPAVAVAFAFLPGASARVRSLSLSKQRSDGYLVRSLC
jgi:hypothetical protein